MTIETDKRTERFFIRIPEVLKHDLEKLTNTQKTELNEKILIVMARAVHDASFKPELYLKTD